MFPYSTVRPVQQECMDTISQALENQEHAIIHAPTGVGKTVAALVPALEYAIPNKKVIFFLTGRHTQHLMALRTLKEIQEQGHEFGVIDLIAKKHMCLVPEAQHLRTGDFRQFCRESREKRTCSYYKQTKKSDGELSQEAHDQLKQINNAIMSTNHMLQLGKKCHMCPYELATEGAKEAKVIIADYNYIFNENIQVPFMIRIQKELKDAIIIVDEAHNLPTRLIDMASIKISTRTITRAINEAEKESFDTQQLQELNTFMHSLTDNEQERLFHKEELIKVIDHYDDFVDNCMEQGEQVRKQHRQSSLLFLGEFLHRWKEEDQGYARILRLGEHNEIDLRCLDPGLISRPVVNNAHSIVLMSGTLTPTTMYEKVLGFPEHTHKTTLANPYPQENALHVIVPSVTTQYQQRGEEQYYNIAQVITRSAEYIPGNIVVFFPSYQLRNQVGQHIDTQQVVMYENQQATKQEKEQLLTKFTKTKDAILLATASGNFGEGIDIPDNVIKAVMVVGLPLAKPDVETQQKIAYYDKHFGKGWDYAYIYPAINTTLQNAGRCIRSETDKGVIMYLDQRYTWKRYQECFPEHINFKVTTNPLLFENFFD